MKKKLHQKLFVQKSVVVNLSHFNITNKFRETGSLGSSGNGCGGD